VGAARRGLAAARIDLNGDVGEGMAGDRDLIPLLTSANVACGGHAGDDATMDATIAWAAQHGVAVGAHPGHEDRANFGRVERSLAPKDVEELVATQVMRLAARAAAQQVALRHVKPHGALYHQLARDGALATACIAAVARVAGKLAIVGPAGSALEAAARAAGHRFVREGFADRTYQRDGTLTPRSRPDALIRDEEQAVVQALSLARDGLVRAVDGSEVRVAVDTLCLHGDTPHAVAFARRLRRELAAHGIAVAAPRDGAP
jgi:UPF0271 protein